MSYTLDQLFDECLRRKASDIYLSVGYPPSLRVGESIVALGTEALKDGDILALLRICLSQDMLREFQASLEFNTSIAWMDSARFRVNLFYQQHHVGAVIRRIETTIPTAQELGLPASYTSAIMENRGLILITGPAGSGKTTSLAAMIGHRNLHGSGHIVTVEDPIEFVYPPRNCIITQRDVGVDTLSFSLALKNALRQRPDVVVIGEARDREAIEHAVNFAETGHLCIATLHARSASQAIERIMLLFPEERHRQVLQSLSLSLRAIFAQRLVQDRHGKKVVATEILLNEGFMRQLIAEGRIGEIHELIEKNRDQGMGTLDQSLIRLYQKGVIDKEVMLAEARNPSDVRLQVKQALAAQQVQMPMAPSPRIVGEGF